MTENDTEQDGVSFRDRLEDACRGCDKSKDEADEIGPVAHGHWAFGPEWSCGDCMDKVGVQNGE